MPSLVPVEIVPAAGPFTVETPPSSAPAGGRCRKSGMIEIELGDGRRVRVDRDIDAEARRRVLDALETR